MRSPSGSAPGSIRGSAPVAISTASAATSVSAGRRPCAGRSARPRPPTGPSHPRPTAGTRRRPTAPGPATGTRAYSRGASTLACPAPPGSELDAEPGRPVQRGHHPRGRDEGLGRHAVGEHAGPAEAVPLDDGDLGAELGGDQGRLVAARAAADDGDPRPCAGSRFPILSHPAAPLAAHRRRPRRATRVNRRPGGRPRTLVTRGDVRGLRQQYGPRPDGAPAARTRRGGHRLAGGLAADLRRRASSAGTARWHRRRGQRPSVSSWRCTR